MSRKLRGIAIELPLLLAVLAAFPLAGLCQTTQGTITGQVVDWTDKLPLENVTIQWTRLDTGDRDSVKTDRTGYYTIPLLSPGLYDVIASLGGFLTQTSSAKVEGYVDQIAPSQKLTVASRLEIRFELRPVYYRWGGEAGRFFTTSDGRLIHYYAADLEETRRTVMDTLDTNAVPLNATLSYFIDFEELRKLPLAGRDAYALLVELPGVTSDNPTARGLGFSANGQRPSAANFLLDGIENNNELITGNLTPIAPEFLKEYRISVSNYSAEFGRTSGFLANAITRSGGDDWHGTAYVYSRNEALNANGFRTPLENRPSLPVTRTPLKEWQPGIWIGGPLRKHTLFASLGLEFLRLRTFLDPRELTVPSASFVGSLPAGSTAANLMKGLLAPSAIAGVQRVTSVYLPSSSKDRYLALPRLDQSWRDGKVRATARLAAARLHRPDFDWTPYSDFVAPYIENSLAAAVGVTAVSNNFSNEIRAGWSLGDVSFNHTRVEVPELYLTRRDPPVGPETMLPGSSLPLAYRNRNSSWQIFESAGWVRGKHAIKFGGGVLGRRLSSALALYPQGLIGFRTLDDFAAGRLAAVFAPIVSPRIGSVIAYPDFLREYRQFQFNAFAQDSIKLTPAFSLETGVRYENFGSPVNTGTTKDALVVLAAGNTFGERVKNATLQTGRPGTQRLYDPDFNNWAARLGFAWNWLQRPEKNLVLRGGYGIFYSRTFDNLWQDLSVNSSALGHISLDQPFPQLPYIGAIRDLMKRPGFASLTSEFPLVAMFQRGLRDPYIQSSFLGLEAALTPSLAVSAHGSAALARKLIAGDVVNRESSLSQASAAGKGPPLQTVAYRSNQGGSSYQALTATIRYRGARAQVQAAWTWSHSIDNQTDPLGGSYFDLGFSSAVNGASLDAAAPGIVPAFTAENNSRVDRGNSDFDQRHALTMYGWWQLPSPPGDSMGSWLARDWSVAALAAVRGGFPFTVFTTNQGLLLNTRASLKPGAQPLIRQRWSGGYKLLNAESFDSTGLLPAMGRNVFRGPGLFSMDVSVSRSFRLSSMNETLRATVRADAYNALNHSNLNNPNTFFTANNGLFGVASYRRTGQTSAFPGAVPLDEVGRQIQLSFRIEF